MILVGRQIRLEKDVRKAMELNKHIKSEIDKLKGVAKKIHTILILHPTMSVKYQ